MSGLLTVRLEITTLSLLMASALFRNCPGATTRLNGLSGISRRRTSLLPESMRPSQFHPRAYLRHTLVCLALSRRLIGMDGLSRGDIN